MASHLLDMLVYVLYEYNRRAATSVVLRDNQSIIIRNNRQSSVPLLEEALRVKSAFQPILYNSLWQNCDFS